ncbi:MAG: DUF4920 domain-containing protein [Myxococcales bacterium]|nr:DUF4920 domain-containing protein [Myxococcales bacterium]MCB9541535.1 DUF4920 domain-containing protein [Myxococcales bacterium]
MFETLFLIAALFGPAASQPAADTAVKMADTAVVHRGAPFALAEKDRTTLDAIAAKAPEMAGKTVQVAGKVQTVCQKKGCWMTMAGEKARARITFKDYAFFVPLDSDGHDVIVEGVVEVKTLDEGERRHLAEDAGKSIDEIPQHELRLVASAVELRQAKK